MKILITGADGFIGKNLISRLRLIPNLDIYKFTRDMPIEILDNYCKSVDFIYHLAGINRSKNENEFLYGNYELGCTILNLLKKYNNKAPIMFASSIQIKKDNLYGKTKLMFENTLLDYSITNNVKIYIYRLKNIFGKWCKPNYNSVVATFCYNIARNIPIEINDKEKEIDLIYIDDVVDSLISLLNREDYIKDKIFYNISKVYTIKLKELARIIKSFYNNRENITLPDVKTEGLEKKLYSTYLTYLPKDKLKYTIKMNKDERGSFTELFRTKERGQFSINISKPNVIKGNHWHCSKNEKFIVIKGKAIISLRHINEKHVIEYSVSEKKLEVIDIPPGYVHNIINIGDSDLITFIWCNECYDPNNPDTYKENV